MLSDIIYFTIKGNDVEFIKLCLLKLYERQTEAEQVSAATLELNTVGFTSGDSSFLTIMAEQLKRDQPLTITDWERMRLKLLKYCRQLSTIEEIAQYFE